MMVLVHISLKAASQFFVEMCRSKNITSRCDEHKLFAQCTISIKNSNNLLQFCSIFRTVCDPEIDLGDIICVKAGANASEVKIQLKFPISKRIKNQLNLFYFIKFKSNCIRN